MSVDQTLAKAAKLAKNGQKAEAERLYRDVLHRFPANQRALKGLQALAASGFQHQSHPELRELLSLRDEGRLTVLIERAEAIIQREPGITEIQNILAAAYAQLGRFEEALASYNKIIDLQPDRAEMHFHRGLALQNLKRFDEAVASYDAVIQLMPDRAEAHHNRGIALANLRRFEQALASFDTALQIKPLAETHYRRGVALQHLGRFDEALASYDKALQLKPLAEAYNKRGVALQNLNRFDEALANYEKALQLKPDYAEALCYLLWQRAQMCLWQETAHSARVSELGVVGDAVTPFMMLAVDDSPSQQLARARAWANAQWPSVAAAPVTLTRSARPARLRIGYFSADFYNHATMALMAKMLELHDRNRFEIHAFAFGGSQSDMMRQRVMKAVDRFHDVRALSDSAVADRARREAIDIAIDLKGYTQEGRSGIFAGRPAAVQISYLGYPGTMGAGFIDYLIADKIVAPPASQRFYDEKMIYLPHSYQVNDNSRTVADGDVARAQFGLPEHAFVFCCFNNNYKISAAEFDVWMRLLGAVEGSVLWLLESNPWAEGNLRREAQARGIAASRLVFAEKLPGPEHLARHRCADLFLDTFNVNAHTTASDALWAGLPVVTKLGQSFVARVAGSLVHAVGLPEMAVETVEAYERLALELATQPDRLAALRSKLATNRLTAPLFDTERYTREIERGYDLAYRRYAEGLAPDHIEVN